MHIVSYNVNGIRAALRNGLGDWLAQQQPDIFCVQETKVDATDFDATPFTDLGYTAHLFPAQKKGYSGTAIFSRLKPKQVVMGCGHLLYDTEGRVIRLDFDHFSVLSCYFPSGTSGDERQGIKMEFLEYFLPYVKKLENTHPRLIVCGDFNICHKPIDIHDPVRNKDVTGFKPEERAWMDRFFEAGFVDTFRAFHAEPHRYSWWSYRAGARKNNKGWRIDYIAVTENLRSKLTAATIYDQAVHSDHCPVGVTLEV